MKRVYRNHATKYTIRKICGWWCFHEWLMPTFGNKLYPTRAKAVSAMQKDSKRHYGEKAK